MQTKERLRLHVYRGEGWPTSEQRLHNTKVLAQELKLRTVPLEEDLEHSIGLCLRVNHPKRKATLYSVYLRYGFIVEGDMLNMKGGRGQTNLHETIRLIIHWYIT